MRDEVCLFMLGDTAVGTLLNFLSVSEQTYLQIQHANFNFKIFP